MALTFWVLASLVQLAFCYLSSTELSLLQIVAHTVRPRGPSLRMPSPPYM